MCPQTEYIKAKYCDTHSDGVFELNSHNQGLMLGRLVGIQKQSAIKEAEEPEPEPKLKTMMIAKWTEELGLNEAGITMLEDEDID
jgi:hypothetical protein